MNQMLARSRRGPGDQRGEKRRLAVVQGSIRDDGDDDIVVEIDGIATRGRSIAAAPADDLPRPLPEEVLALHSGIGRFDPTIGDLGSRRDLLGVGPPNDLKVALAIHLMRHG